MKDIHGHNNKIYALAISKDKKYLVSGSADKKIILWNMELGAEIRSFSGHTGGISVLAISADNKIIVSGGYDS